MIVRSATALRLAGMATRRAMLSSTSRRAVSTKHDAVELACETHAPPHPKTDKETSPILFLHGLFGSKRNNRTMSKVLARDLGRFVFALDLRNHGDSPRAHRHNYLAMADDVEHFIEKNSIRQPTLIGHSMGAKTAMALALRSPSLIRDIVAVDNAPIDAHIGNQFSRYIQGMKKAEASNVTRKEADSILQEYEESLPIRQFLLSNLERPEGQKSFRFRLPLDTLGKSLDHMGDFPFKDPEAARFEKPALFVRGTQSKYVPDDVIPIIGRFFPRFELADIDCGHWVISEKPEEFRHAVVQFLKGKESE